ncbi:Ca2+-binding EF-hand superfamily protein [Duganella sp. SG902]|uniref:EF-hand domain-containing protein n=1 Tax=Duganella sp. SG902 TaxID=2587016 RepID=UPI00159D83C1|nr:EF-hand domain-containing protein [Duganella sp. SG902]NVM79548.1 Ca2+-binding EF-hand superfamily protein [Duganella sp. SG902]
MTTAISSTSSNSTSAATFDPSKGAARFASRVFKDMDADTDGKVSKDEFVKGLESKGVSSEDATKQYEAIDKEGTGSITKDDLESAIKSGDFKPPRPQGGGAAPQGGGGGASSVSASSAKTYEAADKNEDGTVTQQEQLVYDMAQAAKSAAASTSADKLGTNIDALA